MLSITLPYSSTHNNFFLLFFAFLSLARKVMILILQTWVGLDSAYGHTILEMNIFIVICGHLILFYLFGFRANMRERCVFSFVLTFICAFWKLRCGRMMKGNEKVSHFLFYVTREIEAETLEFFLIWEKSFSPPDVTSINVKKFLQNNSLIFKILRNLNCNFI